jgi:glucose-6-phosphate 1-dehydrogenase
MDKPVILVLVGVTGDLARRKLLKAIASIGKKEQWADSNKKFKVLGVTRQEGITVEHLAESFSEDASAVEFLNNHVEIFSMDMTDLSAYEKLSEKMLEVEKDFGELAQRLYYLSVPAQASQNVIEMLGKSALAKVPDTKLMIEKPFGSDYASAQELIEHISEYFSDEQIYRIDHFLAKGIAEEIIAAKDSDSELHKKIQSGKVQKITVLASEKIGVEGRGNFYEQTGALRDLIQSHLLQLAALTIMKTAASDRGGNEMGLQERRLAALKLLSIPTDKPIDAYVTRGQYEGYREEVKNPDSMVETYVSITLNSSESNLAGVPIVLTTGKNLAEKKTEVRIDDIVFEEKGAYDAYEKVFLNAIKGDTALFVSSEEVLECWRILRPVQVFWNTTNADLQIYKIASKNIGYKA